MGSGLWPLEWWWVKEWVWGGWHSHPTHDDETVMNGAPDFVGVAVSGLPAEKSKNGRQQVRSLRSE
jgi:hypothetical protein